MNKYIIVVLVAISLIATGCSCASKYSVKNTKPADTEVLFEGAF